MRTTIAALAATFVVATAGFAFPQDPVPLSPQMYTVLLENEHVRVLEFRCKPGDKEPMHSHPAMVAYSLTATKLRSTTRDGETVERETKPGTAEWVEAMTHSGECLGPGEHRAILTELKRHGLATERDGDPMARFAPFVGEWNVRHTLWTSDRKEQVFEGIATIYFVEAGAVLVVDEFDLEKRYRFIGFHSFDSTTGKYVNWTASSGVVLAWSEGEWNDSREVFRTRRLDPRSGLVDPLIGHGVWTIVDHDTHVFRGVRLGPDGSEIPFKEERYTRVVK